jgi:hypothetical protein
VDTDCAGSAGRASVGAAPVLPPAAAAAAAAGASKLRMPGWSCAAALVAAGTPRPRPTLNVSRRAAGACMPEARLDMELTSQ